jgi:hypothetical protein
MAIIFRTHPQNPNVPYDGKVLPKDKAPARQIPPDPNVIYDGSTLPADKVTYIPFVDKINTPGSVTLISPANQIILPPDTLISIHAEKHLVMTNILDGVSVFEHIQRKPCRIEFEGTLRMQIKGGVTYENTTPPAGLTGLIDNVFPQDYLNALWTNIFLPATVLKVANSYLNGLGIQEIVIEGMSPSVVRGSRNVPYHITAWENVPGQSLIIT